MWPSYTVAPPITDRASATRWLVTAAPVTRPTPANASTRSARAWTASRAATSYDAANSSAPESVPAIAAYDASWPVSRPWSIAASWLPLTNASVAVS